MTKREEVEQLHIQGLSYNQIVEKTGYSKSAVAWHLNKRARTLNGNARRKNRKKFARELKLRHGGKCQRCGYSKSLDALQFHHTDPATKLRLRKKNGTVLGVLQLAQSKSQKLAVEEASKCELLCANCHFEEHDDSLRCISSVQSEQPPV